MAEKEERGVDSLSLTVISDQEQVIARKAAAEFEFCTYNACLSSLKKLESLRPHDPKLQHNKAVTEFYLSGCKATPQYQRAITSVCKQAGIKLDEMERLDDVNQGVLYLNHAVILYHHRQYRAAITILNKLFSFVEPLDDRLVARISCLLCECYLCIQQPDMALGIVSFMENSLKSGKEPSGHEGEVFKGKVVEYRVKCYLQMRNIKVLKKEVKNLTANGGNNMSAIFMKGNLEYLKGNHRKAVHFLNSAAPLLPMVSLQERGESLPVMYYNNMACIHFRMGKPNLATFYLHKASQENEAALRGLKSDSGDSGGVPLWTQFATRHPELLYNMGICLLHAGKPRAAFDCLVDAIQVFHFNPLLWLRLAECCIAAYKADNEVDFHLQERKKDLVQGTVGVGVHRKIILPPRISTGQPQNVEEGGGAMPVVSLEFASFCLKNSLFLLAEPIIGKKKKKDSTGEEEEEKPLPKISSPTSSPTKMASAQVCPSNPLKTQELGWLKCSVLASSAYVSLRLGDPLQALHHALTLLEQPKLPGVYRLLGHLYAAEALVGLDKISEAIDHLNPDNIKDASIVYPPTEEHASNDHREKEREKEREREREGSREANPMQPRFAPKWFPNSLSTAKMVMQYNLTVAHSLRGELEKAGESLKTLWVSKDPNTDIPIQVILLALYIQVQLGHTDIARKIIKQHCPQYR